MYFFRSSILFWVHCFLPIVVPGLLMQLSRLKELTSCLHHQSKPSVSEPSSDRIIIIVKIIWRKKCTTSHKFDSRKFGYLQMVFLANTYLWFLVYLILLSWVSQSIWTSQLGLGVLYIFRLFTELFFLSLFFICFL